VATSTPSAITATRTKPTTKPGGPSSPGGGDSRRPSSHPGPS
jgi:hypothetical protein